MTSLFTLGEYEIQMVGQLLTMMLAPILFGIAALRERRITTWKRAWP